MNGIASIFICLKAFINFILSLNESVSLGKILRQAFLQNLYLMLY